MKKVSTFLFICTFLFVIFTTFNTKVLADKYISMRTDPYTYPIVPGTDEWNSLDGAVEKREACFVSPEVMENMTTAALVETVIKYPLLIDIYAYDTVKLGLERLSRYFQGVEILSKRRDAVNKLINYISKENVEENTIEYVLIKTLIAQFIKTGISLPYRNEDDVNFFRSPPTTPNGHDVPYVYNLTWSDHDMTQSDADLITYSFTYTYNSATIGAPANPAYNCHSFAWYSQNPLTNKYWIPDPTPYFTDYSYTPTIYTTPGNRITYTASVAYDHSGIIFSNSGSTLVVKSKWGCYGVLTHNYNDCPYYSQYTTITYWH